LEQDHTVPSGLYLSSQKSNKQPPFQVDFFKSGRPTLFCKSKSKRLIRRRSRALVCCFKRAIPMAEQAACSRCVAWPALTVRGIKTARGGTWTAVQVSDILRRA
jgi:hypothetical protein